MEGKQKAPCLRSNGICQHYDCKYFAGTHTANRCDYISITGNPRLLWHRQRKLSTDVRDCQLYEKGEKLRTVKQKSLGANYQDSEPPKQFTTGRVKRSNILKKDEEPAVKSKLIKAETKRKANDDRREKIRTLVLEGKPDIEIAEIIGMSKSTVEKTRHELGIFYNRRDKTPAQLEKEKLWERLYKEGFGTNVIAQLTNSSVNTIRIWRDSNGIPILQTNGITKAEKERRKKLLEELGLSETGKGGKRNEPVNAS